MNLIVDMGNTLTKIAVIDGNNEVLQEWRSDVLSEAQLDEAVGRYSPVGAIVSSTRGDEERVCAMLEGRIERVLRLGPQTPVPIGIDYATPQTLGPDRVALAVGAVEMFGLGDMLIVDFGTAITIDLVQNGVFRGGNISPGVDMRFRALHEQTARLPMCSEADVSELLGDSTATAIEQGVMRGVFYEINGYVESFRKKNSEIRIIFSGGDAKRFVNRIKNTIFASCNMMYVGLNRILEYNAAENVK